MSNRNPPDASGPSASTALHNLMRRGPLARPQSVELVLSAVCPDPVLRQQRMDEAVTRLDRVVCAIDRVQPGVLSLATLEAAFRPLEDCLSALLSIAELHTLAGEMLPLEARHGAWVALLHLSGVIERLSPKPQAILQRGDQVWQVALHLGPDGQATGPETPMRQRDLASFQQAVDGLGLEEHFALVLSGRTDDGMDCDGLRAYLMGCRPAALGHIIATASSRISARPAGAWSDDCATCWWKCLVRSGRLCWCGLPEGDSTCLML